MAALRRRLRIVMGDAYAAFGLALAVVAALGGVLAAPRMRVGLHCAQNADTLVAILGVMTSAALLSVAFLGDKIAAPGPLRLVPGSDLGSAVGLTAQMLLVGGAGLTCALIGLALPWSEWVRRWAGGCLAVSCLIVLVLFPAPLVLILEVAAAGQGP